MNEKSKTGKRIRVGVIFGGRSGEHEVSLNSAQSVMQALSADKYEVIPIGINKNGRWLTGDVVAALTEGRDSAQLATLLPDPQAPGLMQMDMAQVVPVGLSEVATLDVIFPVLHGTYGEDGTMQGLLELAGIPYVGAGVLGSAVAMDKGVFKQVMSAQGIPVLPWAVISTYEWRTQPEAILDKLVATFAYPIFTKPANLGSSVGVSKCDTRAELAAGIALAAQYDRRIVIEQGIQPRELEVSVLGNHEPIASVVGEVRPRRDFYDYVAKYVAPVGSEDESELMIPADLDEETAVALQHLAITAYKAIDCAGMARVDMMLDSRTGQIYMNEINTIPGFTNISMYAKLWAASGLTYEALVDRLIELALERYEEKCGLKTTFDVMD